MSPFSGSSWLIGWLIGYFIKIKSNYAFWFSVERERTHFGWERERESCQQQLTASSSSSSKVTWCTTIMHLTHRPGAGVRLIGLWPLRVCGSRTRPPEEEEEGEERQSSIVITNHCESIYILKWLRPNLEREIKLVSAAIQSQSISSKARNDLRRSLHCTTKTSKSGRARKLALQFGVPKSSFTHLFRWLCLQ